MNLISKGNRVKYIGNKIGSIAGLVGEVVATSEIEYGVPLVTIWYKDIDKKFTVQAVNVEPA